MDLCAAARRRTMGVVAFAKSLADEVGRDGILVNNVCPGSILTERMLSNVTARAKESASPCRTRSPSAPPRPRSDASAIRGRWPTLLVDGGLVRSAL